MNFKWKTGLVSFPLFDLQRNTSAKNGKLWIVCNDDNGTPFYKLLTDREVNEAIKYCHGHKCTDADVKRRLAKALLDLHEDESGQEDNLDEIEVITPFCKLSYNGLLNRAEVTRHNNFRFNIQQPSSGFRDFLHGLTGSDKKRLDDFAELLARLYRPELLSDYLWCIVGKASDISCFLEMLHNNLDLYGFSSGIFEKPSNESLIHFLNSQGSNAAYQINSLPGDSKSFKAINHNRIKEFISGKIIGTIDDPYVINGEVTGKGVLIYAALELSEDCIGRLPHKIIQLPDDCASFKLNADDIIWMQTCLLCHGLHLLNMSEAEPSNDTLSLGQALRKFVRSFCEIREGAWTDQFRRF